MPRGIPLLKDNLEFDEKDGTVQSNVAAIKAALIIYLQNGYGESNYDAVSHLLILINCSGHPTAF